MEKFFSVVIVVIISFYLLKGVLRLILPFLLKILVQKMGERTFGQGFNFTNHQEKETVNEGEVTVTNHEKKSSKNTKNKGEYIDFEEVK
jgi:hypothetical protein